MQSNNTDDTCLNNRELTSVLALVSYVAHAKNCDEGVVLSLVQQHLDINSVNSIHTDDYNKAIHFLIDMAPVAA
ncbi:MAG: hypothetical protein FWF23_03780 [Alphaproteobacteria bacterium]|nr:hypothetical protein [Alphaproteobacteria bacterium]MCL2504680.1 hypothetical protein [Alphaproteobacteria bacterium]